MAIETQQNGTPTAELVGQIAQLLAKPRDIAGIKLDTAYFAASNGTTTPQPQARVLLPGDYHWEPIDADGTPRVPLQLCEFLAYKTALAYEPEDRIKNFLKQCCGDVTRIRVFDSARNKENDAGVLADAQAYGFVFERKAFVIFRGTASGNDWKINRIDALTSDLGKDADRRNTKLRKDYGVLLNKLGDPVPGRHVGFSIAWAALKDEVEDWLADGLEQREIDKIIYSGHSLGGAMAQVAAFDHARIEANFERDRGISPDRVGAVVTFGAPAVGGPEFAREYKRLLGNRTVLLESSGDLVPRIMNRWYYRMLYPLRQRVMAGVQAHLVASQGFGKVSTPWTFASEPPLSDADIDTAMSNIREAAARALKELAEQQKKREKEEAEKAAAKQNGDAKSTDAASQPQASKSDVTKAEPMPSWVYWAVVGVVVIVVGGVTWYFVRRKLFSHDIEQRYALYLSTIAYQQLRAKHGGDLDLANKELVEHLRFVRGDLASSKTIAIDYPDIEGKTTAFFDSVRDLPVPIKIRNDPVFVEFLKRNDTFV
jgi:pimeloyl-ACP methyl ester carboxylesterase